MQSKIKSKHYNNTQIYKTIKNNESIVPCHKAQNILEGYWIGRFI